MGGLKNKEIHCALEWPQVGINDLYKQRIPKHLEGIRELVSSAN